MLGLRVMVNECFGADGSSFRTFFFNNNNNVF